MIPLLDHELLVGSVHVGNPRSAVMMDEGQMAMLSDFVAKMPLLINRLIEMNRIRDFVLLDPASHVANRAGLLRDLEREIGRARRSKRAPLLVALKLVGLESMRTFTAAYSAQNPEICCGEVIRGLGHGFHCKNFEEYFGVMVVDAPSEDASKIVGRWKLNYRANS